MVIFLNKKLQPNQAFIAGAWLTCFYVTCHGATPVSPAAPVPARFSPPPRGLRRGANEYNTGRPPLPPRQPDAISHYSTTT